MLEAKPHEKKIAVYFVCPLCNKAIPRGEGNKHLAEKHPDIAKTHVWLEDVVYLHPVLSQLLHD